MRRAHMDYDVDSGGCRISYSVEGPIDRPALLLSNSIGTTRELWSRQVAAFCGTYRLICYDARGHGGSGVPDGEYTIEQLGRDALAVLDAQGIRSAHVCGISLGGVTAMWLGANAPERISSLVLANTATRVGTVQSWTDRIALVRGGGMAAVAERAIPIWFSKAFRERDPDSVHAFGAMLRACSPEGYIGCCAALRDADLREAVRTIACPTLVIAGSEDASTTPEQAEFTRSRIAASRLVTLPTAHLSNVEDAEAFASAVLEFLGSAESVNG